MPGAVLRAARRLNLCTALVARLLVAVRARYRTQWLATEALPDGSWPTCVAVEFGVAAEYNNLGKRGRVRENLSRGVIDQRGSS